jgi:hypothetical protein
MYLSREGGRTEEQDKGRWEGLQEYISINCILISLIIKISSQLNGCINQEAFYARLFCELCKLGFLIM